MVELVESKAFPYCSSVRGFCVCSLNTAESGQSVVKTRGKMWLSVAAWRDTCTMIIQDRDYISFCTNKTNVTRKGLSHMQQKEKEEQKGTS